MKKSKKNFELILQLHGIGSSLKKAFKQTKKAVKKAVNQVGKETERAVNKVPVVNAVAAVAKGLVKGSSAAGQGAEGQATATETAPTITAAQATEGHVGDEMDTYKSRLRKAKGKSYTDQTGGYAQGIKKSLLGE